MDNKVTVWVLRPALVPRTLKSSTEVRSTTVQRLGRKAMLNPVVGVRVPPGFRNNDREDYWGKVSCGAVDAVDA